MSLQPFDTAYLLAEMLKEQSISMKIVMMNGPAEQFKLETLVEAIPGSH